MVKYKHRQSAATAQTTQIISRLPAPPSGSCCAVFGVMTSPCLPLYVKPTQCLQGVLTLGRQNLLFFFYRSTDKYKSCASQSCKRLEQYTPQYICLTNNKTSFQKICRRIYWHGENKLNRRYYRTSFCVASQDVPHSLNILYVDYLNLCAVLTGSEL